MSPVHVCESLSHDVVGVILGRETEVGWELHGTPGPSHAHLRLLERLPQRLEMAARQLANLVEK